LITAKKANSDSTLATGYYSNEKARVDTTERNSLIAKKTSLSGEIQWTTLTVAADDVRAGAGAWNALADLGFTGTASKRYEIEGCIFVTSATATVGVNLAFNCAAGTLSGIFESTASATTYTAKVIATITDSSASVHAGVVDLYYPQRFRVVWVVDGSNRAFAMQWRKEQVTGTMNQTVGQGSWIHHRIIK
jgi:hypothetical protein